MLEVNLITNGRRCGKKDFVQKLVDAGIASMIYSVTIIQFNDESGVTRRLRGMAGLCHRYRDAVN